LINEGLSEVSSDGSESSTKFDVSSDLQLKEGQDGDALRAERNVITSQLNSHHFSTKN